MIVITKGSSEEFGWCDGCRKDMCEVNVIEGKGSGVELILCNECLLKLYNELIKI